MIRLLLIPFVSLLFASCEDVYTSNDELFYRISKADSSRCMDEILEGIWMEGKQNVRKIDYMFDSVIPYCGPREAVDVSLNGSGQVMVRERFVTTGNMVCSEVFRYFMFNRNLSSEESYKRSMDLSYPGFEFTFYSFYSEKEIEGMLESLKKEQQELIVNPLRDTIELRRVKDRIIDFESRLCAQRLIGRPLAFPSSGAHVRFSYPSSLKKSEVVKREIELAYYQMRNYECMRYFGETYLSLYDRFQRKNRSIDKEKLEAIEVLRPNVIYDKNLEVSPRYYGPVEAPPLPR